MKSLFSPAVACGLMLLAQNLAAKDKGAVTPLEQAVIVDADGDRLGSVLGLNGPMALTLIQFQGRLFSINVSKNGLLGTGSPVLFTTANCTGTAYVSVGTSGLVTLSTIAPPGNSLYAEDPNGIPQVITPLSLLVPSGPGGQPGSCQSTTPPPPPGVPPPSPPQILAVPAVRLIDLNTVFTAPFSIRTAH